MIEVLYQGFFIFDLLILIAKIIIYVLSIVLAKKTAEENMIIIYILLPIRVEKLEEENIKTEKRNVRTKEKSKKPKKIWW